MKNLFYLEVDLIFVDTTSTYFEVEAEDPDGVSADDEATTGLRKRGYSKDSRVDPAQAVLDS